MPDITEEPKVTMPDGTKAEPMQLSDLQQNNMLIRKYFKYVVIWCYIVLGVIIYMIYYVIHNNVVNNIVARCV